MAKNKFFNRELSWIEFNARVLHEATRREIPLLERLNFLAITGRNFDEFFQVRVASIKRQELSSPHTIDSTGLLPSVLLKKISQRCHQLTKLQNETLMNDVLPSLAREGIIYTNASQYSQAQKTFTESLFRHEIFPVLTPLRTDGDIPIHIGNLALNAAFLLEPMEGIKITENVFATKKTDDIVAIVPIPPALSRIVWLPSNDNTKHFTVLDDIISLYGKELFPGYTVKETMMFKIARDADFAVDEDSGNNFIQAMEEVLKRREFSLVVRMVCNSTSPKLMELIKNYLHLSEEDTYLVNGLIEPSSLLGLIKTEGTESLLYPEWKHFYSDDLPEEKTYWNTLRQNDILLNVPYQSFDPVIKFIEDASTDENVLAIKITLYRPGNNSPIVKALIDAAQNGKQVTVFMELKARFDEKQNIQLVNELENAGVIVVYGVANLKVHAKIALIIRRETDGIRRYTLLSTGNFNQNNAKAYQDFSILTSDVEIATDATMFFNVISGYSALQTMHQLYMAPVNLKSHLIELIDREIKLSTPEEPGLIIAKMNSLCHEEIIEKLYEASEAGIQIQLNIRGICTLVPETKGLSENITVTSIIDRYLEHSRVFYFKNGGNEELYLASSDWMERNLDKRIELMFPVRDKKVFKTIKESLLLYFQDNCHSHTLSKDGSWKIKEPEKKEQIVRAQEVLYKKYKKHHDAKKKVQHIDFEVRRKG